MTNIKYQVGKLQSAKYLWIVLISLAARVSAQPTPARSLLALSKAEHVLAIIDPLTLKIIAKVPVGADPHEVDASTDGKTAYVTIYGGGSLHELNLIDLVAQKPLPSVDTKPLLWSPWFHILPMANTGLRLKVPRP